VARHLLLSSKNKRLQPAKRFVVWSPKMGVACGSRAKVFRRKGPPFRVTFVENSKLETNFNLTSFKHPKTSENTFFFWVEFVLEFVL